MTATVDREEPVVITALRTEGLRAAEKLDLTLDRPIAALGQGPSGQAALDALELLLAACDPARASTVLARLGVLDPFEEVEVTVVEDLPVQIAFDHGDVGGLLASDATRTLKIRLDLDLDPLLFGELREWALRDPRLVAALGEATASLTVGWVFTNDLRAASIDRLALRIGQASLPTTGAERPRWLAGWLRTIAGRFRRVTDDDLDVVAERVHSAQLSADPERRARAAVLCDALAAPPFSLGRLELVQVATGLVPCFGPKLLRPRLVGRRGADRLRLAEAALLDQPDVLLLDQLDPSEPELLAWLRGLTQGDDAILEQVLIADGAG